MPDVGRRQEEEQGARRAQQADKLNSPQAGVGKLASEQQAQSAVQDLRDRASQNNTAAEKQVASSHQNLGRFAESQDALKKGTEQERKDLDKALGDFAGRQQDHLDTRQELTNGVAEAARGAVEALAADQARERAQAPAADQSRLEARDREQWTAAQKIVDQARDGVDAVRASDDARLRESRDKVVGALSGKPADLAAQLDDDARQADAQKADLQRDTQAVTDRLTAAFETLRRTAVGPEKTADREEGRVTGVQAIRGDARSGVQRDAQQDDRQAVAAAQQKEARAREALEEATRRADEQREELLEEMTQRHEREQQTMARLKPDDRERQQALKDAQDAQRKALDQQIRELQDRIKDLKQSFDRDQQSGPDRSVKADAIADEATKLELTKQLDMQMVRESNLFYDFDHWQPKSKEEHQEKSNQASNIGFLMADENRRKGATEFQNLPEMRKQPLSLKDELAKGEDAARKAVGDMLGSLRFKEVKELDVLWQRASDNEKRSYNDAQGRFRQLLGGDNAREPAAVQEAAKTVREALKAAKVDIVPNGESFRLRLDDSDYRR